LDRFFEPLTAAEEQWVRDQLVWAHEFVRASGQDNRNSELTLKSLDQAFERYLASDGDPSTANAVVLAIGAAFGTRLVEDLGFQWVVVKDDYGTDLAVLARPGRGDVTIVPGDFVAKRYERKEAPFLVAAFTEIRDQLREIATEWGESAQ
jgi:Domain of unknown function (DUF3806)